ncbi:MAG: MFS transporter [Armatimonadota bacterium]|nr:MFS transporter [Armatimonadota bacterium]MDR7451140.1 MFS transporter [Armatimonadota bacterium]MDR7467255.1 MFS transporter [Armatimonadota bacterium]MDR7494516.1 MFS transporter [Armatimonadota bacterium]MDR7499907.1 MFS transporter [Armatimonadota bacterium]
MPDDTAVAVRQYVPPFSPLRHRNFRLLWTGLLVSNTGSWMQFVALGYLVDRLTESPLYLGVLAAAQAVPRIAFSLLGGAMADRIDRRRLLFATNLFLMVSASLLAALTISGQIRIWQVLAIAAVNSLAQSFDMPARHSMVPALVDEREVLSAVSLNSVAFNGAGIFGPSLGGLIIAWIGEGGCFLLNAVSFLGTLGALLLMRVPRQERGGQVRISEDLREGWRLLREHRHLLLFLATVATTSFFGRPYVRLLPTYAREVLGVGATALGLLQSAPGIGTVFSALVVGRASARRGKGTLLGTAVLLYGVLVTAFGFARSFPLALALLVLMGMMQAMALASANTLVQLNTPSHARGRLMGFYSMVAFGGMALGSLPVGAVGDVVGVGPALSGGGVILILLALVFIPRLRAFE